LPGKSTAAILIALMSLVAPRKARAEDLTIVFKITDKGGERAATHYFTAQKARFDQGDHVTLVDFSAGRVSNLSMRRQQYSETTFAEIEQAMSSTSAQMEKAMAGIPESLRDKMAGDPSKQVSVTKGEIRTVAGLACQNYRLTLGESMRMETCVTTALRPPFDSKNLRNLALVTEPISPGTSGINRMVEKMRTIPGLSIASSTFVTMLGKTIELVMEATEIRSGPIASGVFDLPGDFKKVDSPWH